MSKFKLSLPKAKLPQTTTAMSTPALLTMFMGALVGMATLLMLSAALTTMQLAPLAETTRYVDMAMIAALVITQGVLVRITNRLLNVDLLIATVVGVVTLTQPAGMLYIAASLIMAVTSFNGLRRMINQYK